MNAEADEREVRERRPEHAGGTAGPAGGRERPADDRQDEHAGDDRQREQRPRGAEVAADDAAARRCRVLEERRAA